jgi:cytidine deaminase
MTRDPSPDDLLVERASAVRPRAYAPYSRFAVGAALRAGSGEVYVGVNVENASFGLTICAERSAICAAVSAGETHIQAIAICAEGAEPVPPCGACRQVIREFGAEVRVIMTNTEGARRSLDIAALLPASFTGDELRGRARARDADDKGDPA